MYDKIRMLDLFSGIGGFSLAAENVWGNDIEIVGHCDIDEYCKRVLEINFPEVPFYNDVRKLSSKNLGRVDLICGGFPCQDISQAGKGLGIEKGKRSSLWSEFSRLIGELRPRFAVIENVSALTSRGLNIVLRDLAKTGYDAEWQCIGAYQVGAKHRRDRIWIVAYPQQSHSNSNSIRHLHRGFEEQTNEGGVITFHKPSKVCKEVSNKNRDSSNSCGIRPQWKETIEELGRKVRPTFCNINDRDKWFRSSIFESRLGRMAYGIPNWIHEYWSEEPKGVPRADKTKPFRKERTIALGNSIVPQIPMLIFKRLKEIIDAEYSKVAKK
tara:strand:- start:1942 stop:2919 length:978 start_codon:yes stop_codon:yes gene_type:complete